MKVFPALSLVIPFTALYALSDDGSQSSRIKSVEELRYRAVIVSGVPVKDRLEERTVFIYGEEDRLIEENRYNPDGGLEEKTVYRYNGDRLEQTLHCYDSTSGIIIFYAYNKRGQETETRFLTYEGERGNEYMRITYVYDDRGNLVESKTESATTLVDRWKYDETGKVTEKTHLYSGNADFNLRTVYRYDGQGILIETESYGDAVNLLQRDVYSYNGKGEQSEIRAYAEDGAMLHCKLFSRDENGRITRIEFQQLSPYEYGTRQTFRYDGQGNLTEDSSSHSNGSRKVYTYRYGSNGDLIGKTEYVKSAGGDAGITVEHAEITERKTEYFEH